MNVVAIAIVVGLVLLFVFLISMFNKYLVKASSGQALIKTGFGLNQPAISLSSAFVIPLFNKLDKIDLTVKTVRIERRGHDSLSCADGIRAEVEVDFYIQINPIAEDIRRVAMTIGCERASNNATLREIFEAKFADALKTAGSRLAFDQLYTNRNLFRDEILRALGQSGDGDLVLSGYKLDDVAIQYLEQLPLEKHNENNVLDAKGRKVIAERTSAEAEAANERLRQREITIQEQNQRARIRDLQIRQDIAEKEATQGREVKEIQARQAALTDTTINEQEQLSRQSMIAKDQALKIAEEKKNKEVMTAQIERERAQQVAEQEKLREIEIAKINREISQAEATKEKIRQQEEIARQEAARIRAEEQTNTVKSLEIANRQKQIEIIQAEKNAAVELQRLRVESDAEAYQLTTVAKAKLDSAQLNADAAALQAKALQEIGNAEANNLRTTLQAQNTITTNAMIANALTALIPLLPTLVEKLMLPAEKIESIKVLQVTGMNGGASSNGHSNVNGSAMGGVLGSVLNVSLLLPVLKEVLKLIGTNEEVRHTLAQVPGGDALLKYAQQQNSPEAVAVEKVEPVA